MNSVPDSKSISKLIFMILCFSSFCFVLFSKTGTKESFGLSEAAEEGLDEAASSSATESKMEGLEKRGQEVEQLNKTILANSASSEDQNNDYLIRKEEWERKSDSEKLDEIRANIEECFQERLDFGERDFNKAVEQKFGVFAISEINDIRSYEVGEMIHKVTRSSLTGRVSAISYRADGQGNIDLTDRTKAKDFDMKVFAPKENLYDEVLEIQSFGDANGSSLKFGYRKKRLSDFKLVSRGQMVRVQRDGVAYCDNKRKTKGQWVEDQPPEAAPLLMPVKPIAAD